MELLDQNLKISSCSPLRRSPRQLPQSRLDDSFASNDKSPLKIHQIKNSIDSQQFSPKQHSEKYFISSQNKHGNSIELQARDLRLKNDSLLQDLKLLQSHNRNLDENLASWRERTFNAENHVLSLREQLNEKEEEILRLAEQLKAQDTNSEQIRIDYQKLQSDYQKLQNSKETEGIQWRNNYQDLRSELAGLKEHFYIQCQNNDQLEELLRDLEEKYNQLTNENQRLVNENIHLNEQNTQMINNIEKDLADSASQYKDRQITMLNNSRFSGASSPLKQDPNYENMQIFQYDLPGGRSPFKQSSNFRSTTVSPYATQNNYFQTKSVSPCSRNQLSVNQLSKLSHMALEELSQNMPESPVKNMRISSPSRQSPDRPVPFVHNRSRHRPTRKAPDRAQIIKNMKESILNGKLARRNQPKYLYSEPN